MATVIFAARTTSSGTDSTGDFDDNGDQNNGDHFAATYDNRGTDNDVSSCRISHFVSDDSTLSGLATEQRSILKANPELTNVSVHDGSVSKDDTFDTRTSRSAEQHRSKWRARVKVAASASNSGESSKMLQSSKILQSSKTLQSMKSLGASADDEAHEFVKKILEMPEPKLWTPEMVHKWLKSTKWSCIADNFLQHRIAGHHLVHLTIWNLKDLGVKQVSAQIDIHEGIRVLFSSWANKDLQKPNIVQGLFDGFLIASFLGKSMSSGKDPWQQVDMFIRANNNIAVVSALLLTTSIPLNLMVQGNENFGLHSHPLGFFYLMCFFSGAFLMLSLILAIIYTLIAGQLANETEVEEFFEILGNGNKTPHQFMCVGCWCQFAFYTIFMVFNGNVGAFSGTDLWMYGFIASTLPWFGALVFMFRVSQGVRGLYASKVKSVELVAESAIHRKSSGDFCPCENLNATTGPLMDNFLSEVVVHSQEDLIDSHEEF